GERRSVFPEVRPRLPSEDDRTERPLRRIAVLPAAALLLRFVVTAETGNLVMTPAGPVMVRVLLLARGVSARLKGPRVLGKSCVMCERIRGSHRGAGLPRQKENAADDERPSEERPASHGES